MLTAPLATRAGERTEFMPSVGVGSGRLSCLADSDIDSRITTFRVDFLAPHKRSAALAFAGVAANLATDYTDSGMMANASAAYADLGFGVRWPREGRGFGYAGFGLAILLHHNVSTVGYDYTTRRHGTTYQAGAVFGLRDDVVAVCTATRRSIGARYFVADTGYLALLGNWEVTLGLGVRGLEVALP